MLRHEAPDEKDRLLSEISETLVYLSNTIDDFQSYFKPASQVGSVDVKSVIEQAMEFTAPRARHKKISMHLTCNDGYHVRSNANELIQVLLNLFNNAIDSIVEKDSKLREIVVDVRNERRKIIIAVRDSGGGIPPTVLERLFEPYCSTKGKNGTGLGLYMVKMIVEKQFGGTISGYNIEGGAEFLLTLERSDGVIRITSYNVCYTKLLRALALKEQESGDVVVILGKGDETTQIIYDQHLPFDDREVVRSLLSTAS